MLILRGLIAESEKVLEPSPQPPRRTAPRLIRTRRVTCISETEQKKPPALMYEADPEFALAQALLQHGENDLRASKDTKEAWDSTRAMEQHVSHVEASKAERNDLPGHPGLSHRAALTAGRRLLVRFEDSRLSGSCPSSPLLDLQDSHSHPTSLQHAQWPLLVSLPLLLT